MIKLVTIITGNTSNREKQQPGFFRLSGSIKKRLKQDLHHTCFPQVYRNNDNSSNNNSYNNNNKNK
jgi:hypothetical protein